MTSDGLRLSPFRGLRYAPAKVSSLAAVTSPPYDVVVRPDELHQLETADPYNIVRLILPQADDQTARQGKAAGTLHRWREDGVLALDPEPALYVYEQAFTVFDFGYASAASWVMFLIVVLVAGVNFLLSRRVKGGLL